MILNYGNGIVVDDDKLIVVDPSDGTKQVRLDAGAVTTGTTAVVSVKGSVNLATDGTGDFELAGAAGSVLANQLQAAPTDLGAADVTVDLSNTNGAFVTNVTTDGTVTAATLSGALSGSGAGITAGTIKASSLQAAAADLGAADVTVNLGNTNGAFVTNVTTDGTVTASTALASPILDSATVTVGGTTSTNTTIGRAGQTTNINGNVAFGTAPARTVLAQETATLQIPFTDWCNGANLDSLLGNGHGSAGGSTLGCFVGTFLTDTPQIDTGDAKGAGAKTYKMRAQFRLPHQYVSGQNITFRYSAGMQTTAADNSCTLDLQVARRAAPTVDVCATGAININTVGMANRDFTLTGTTIVAGEILDCLCTIAVNDAATGTEVMAAIQDILLLVPVKG